MHELLFFYMEGSFEDVVKKVIVPFAGDGDLYEHESTSIDIRI